jgi:hypothetical protein
MCIRGFIAAAAIVMGGCGHRGEDNEVLNAALIYFSQQIEEQSSHTAGVLLLRPTMRSWTRESLSGFSDDLGSNCTIAQELYAAVAERATTEQPVASLVSNNARWRIAPEKEQVKFPELPPTEFKGVPVRTLVTVSYPGFSESGDDALVLLSFTHSIHNAIARIRMARSSDVWHAQCVQFNFYV